LKFLIVDDHKLFSDGLSTLLSDIYTEPELISVASGQQAINTLNQDSSFDLVLLDLRLPDMDGIEVLNKIAANKMLVPVAIVSATSNYQEIYAVLKAGALGFMHKSIDRQELEKAINSILNGEKYLSDLSPAATDERQSLKTNIEILTRRQSEVLALLSDGLLNKQIAERLGTSEQTIKIHVSAIMKKLGVRTRTACVSQAIRLGIITKA
jgi:DNA-binding NarL/FixJ family response regulator